MSTSGYIATYFTKVVMDNSQRTYGGTGAGPSDPLKDQFMKDFIDSMKS